MNHRINATLETYCEFLATIPDAAVLADKEGGIVWANRMAVELFGDSTEGLGAQNIQELVPEHLRKSHYEHMRGYWESPTSRPMKNRDRLEALRQDGKRISVAIMLNQLDLQDGRYALAICRDMSSEQREQNDLHEALDQEKVLSTTDPVTGAANRRHFSDELLYEIERSSRHARVFSLAYFDLDNFKDVNDRYGHAEGDRILSQIVEVAWSRLRKTDVIARIGGDEFAILLPETDTTTMQSPITDLLHEMKQSMLDSGWPVTISCGVVTFRTPPGNPEDALRAADQLMYEVKRAGKNASREAVFERGTAELRHSTDEKDDLPD